MHYFWHYRAAAQLDILICQLRHTHKKASIAQYDALQIRWSGYVVAIKHWSRRIYAKRRDDVIVA